MSRHRTRIARWRRGSRAFMLVELLTVVAIISLLIAILLPSLGKARFHAKHVVCQTRLAGLGKAWQSYLTEYSGCFLRNVTTADNYQLAYGGKPGTSLTKKSRPLNKQVSGSFELKTNRDVEAFRCPLDTGRKSIPKSCFDYCGTSYYANDPLVELRTLQVDPYDPRKAVLNKVSARLPRLKGSDMKNASKMLLLRNFGWYRESRKGFAVLAPPSLPAIEWHRRPTWHNVAFLDAHAEWVPIVKGEYVTAKYSIISYRDIQQEIAGRRASTPLTVC